VRLGYEFELNPEQLEARIGVDESGKGDFFGPLVVAAVYVNEPIVREMKKLGVRDSKTITSDKKIVDLAASIRLIKGCRAEVITIMPETYNRLHRSMKNVNNILGWAHARAIENLLGRVECQKAISDQFAHSKAVIRRFLGPKGRQIDLVQRHRAESDYAVAAASVMARDAFVNRLKKMSAEASVPLPKGASEAVKEAARRVAEKLGRDQLPRFVKEHFKTTNEL